MCTANLRNNYRQSVSLWLVRLIGVRHRSPGLPREKREGFWQVKGDHFFPLFCPREAALGYCAQFWCSPLKRDIREPELLTHRES